MAAASPYACPAPPLVQGGLAGAAAIFLWPYLYLLKQLWEPQMWRGGGVVLVG